MSEMKASVKITADVIGADKVDKLKASVGGLDAGADAAQKAAAGIDGIGSAAQRAEQKATPAHRNIRDGIQSISTQLGEVKALYAAWLGAQAAAGAVSGLAASADAWANLTARVKLAVGEGAAFQTAFEGIQEVALRTNSSLENTGNLFVKIADAGKQMGVGQAEALRLTETVNQAVQLSGASAQASSAAITQLIQGLQSGVVRGDEFNSIMEQSPRLAKALAEGLGVTTGELRKMAEAGQLSSQVVIGALQGQAAAVEGEFARLPITVGRAITNLQTEWQRWLGTMDESLGASRTAASAIESLGKHFDLVASGLINAGQAYLGWKAYNIAAEFLSLKTAVAASAAAKTVDTAATIANTAATGANTAAQIANNAAKTGAAGAANGAAAGAGRLAGALSLIKGFSLAFLVTNLVDIGTWLGETAAKATGADKGLKDLERQMKSTENAARAVAAENAALAQKTQIAADQALGLSARAKQLVGDFNELTKGGKTTSEALAQIGKALDLSDIKGVAEAGAALDALAVKGKISADQVREAWRQALNGQDLQKFEVQAIAAFDGSEQGARRLAAALDAQLGEALRRTGLDAGALSAGVNAAAQSAINDFDVLAGRVDQLKVSGVDVGIALAASLDQAGKAATTEAAAKVVTERWEEMGKAGLITGDRLAQGLEKARAAADNLTPGVNSLAEAFKTLGLKSPEELKKAALAAEEAFKKIQQGSGFTRAELANVQEAFRRYAETAIAANGGVATDTLRVQAEMKGLEIVTDSAGKTIVRAMAEGGEAVNGIIGATGAAADGFQKMADAADEAANAADRAATSSDGVRTATTSPSGRIGGSSVDFTETLYRRGASIEEQKLAQKYVGELYQRNQATMLAGNLGNEVNAARLQKQAINDAVDKAIAAARKELATGQATDLGTSVNDIIARNNSQTPLRSLDDMISRIKNAGNEAKGQVFKVDLRTDRKTTSINVGSSQDASALIDTLKTLQSRSA
jgi:tape measure domain-containing protein